MSSRWFSPFDFEVGSKGLNHPELMKLYIACRLGSQFQPVVRAGSKGLNLMSNYSVGLLPTVNQWFKQVQRD